MTPIMVKFKKSRKKVTFFLHLNIECPQYQLCSERSEWNNWHWGYRGLPTAIVAGGDPYVLGQQVVIILHHRLDLSGKNRLVKMSHILHISYFH